MKQPLWIDERDALTLHDRLLAPYGGAAGLRDRSLLESALARTRQLLACAGSPDLIDLAAGTVDEPGFAAWLRANARPARKTR